MISLSEQESRKCRTQKIPGTAIVECKEGKDCEWCMKFGDGRFCIYLSKLGALSASNVRQDTCQGV